MMLNDAGWRCKYMDEPHIRGPMTTFLLLERKEDMALMRFQLQSQILLIFPGHVSRMIGEGAHKRASIRNSTGISNREI